MSTSYYYLREPVTSLHIEAHDPEHTSITVRVRGKTAGRLVVDPEDVCEIVWMMSDREEDDSRAPMRTSFGGAERGCVVTENVRGLDPGLQLVSEYGEILTVREIRARDGAGQKGRNDHG